VVENCNKFKYFSVWATWFFSQGRQTDRQVGLLRPFNMPELLLVTRNFSPVLWKTYPRKPKYKNSAGLLFHYTLRKLKSRVKWRMYFFLERVCSVCCNVNSVAHPLCNDFIQTECKISGMWWRILCEASTNQSSWGGRGKKSVPLVL
jgi:hypothetical protein